MTLERRCKKKKFRNDMFISSCFLTEQDDEIYTLGNHCRNDISSSPLVVNCSRETGSLYFRNFCAEKTSEEETEH
jgi:hypothetical protein